MSNAALKTVAGSSVTALEKDPTSFPGMLRAYRGEIERALPKHMNADRMCRIALTCFRMTPALGKCEPQSIFAALVQSSQLGLEPGLNGRAYLIPYGGECQFVPGWKGLVELANRTGRASCWTGAVFSGDDFDYQLGDTPYVKHRPQGEDDPTKLSHTYAIGRVRGNDWPIIEVWPNDKLLKHRKRFNKVGNRHYSYEHWEMYARKVPLLQVLKYLPSSPELEAAMALDAAFEGGQRQGLTIDGALGNPFEPPVPPATEETTGSNNGAESTEGGEKKKDNGFSVTIADVVKAAHAAKDADGVAIAADLARNLTDDKDKAEADVEIRAAKKRLSLG